jgi:hypothetical protein
MMALQSCQRLAICQSHSMSNIVPHPCLMQYTCGWLQPGNIVINPAVVRNKAVHAITPRKFLVSTLP